MYFVKKVMLFYIILGFLLLLVEKGDAKGSSSKTVIDLTTNNKQVIGQNLGLICKYSGLNVNSIYWEFNGELISLDSADVSWTQQNYRVSAGYKTKGKQDLYIIDFHDKNAGLYTCIVVTDSNTQLSASVSVSVKPEEVRKERDVEVTLSCGDSEHDHELLIWFKDTALLYFNNSFIDKNNRLSVESNNMLILKNVTEADSGLYKCSRNGRGIRSYQLTVSDDITDQKKSLLSGSKGYLLASAIVLMTLGLITAALIYQNRYPKILRHYLRDKKTDTAFS